MKVQYNKTNNEGSFMKRIIASDIHGSSFWCRKLIEQIELHQPEEIILLGDILYHGPRNDLPRDYAPKEVIAMLNPLTDRIVCCRGNCEAEVDQMVLDFDVMDTFGIIFDDDQEIMYTHGHIYNPEIHPELSDGAVLLYGHTHVKHDEIIDGIHMFNPGSVSIPKDGSHSIGLMDKGKLSHIILSE